ncbi:DUF3267 domain-containing protein [Lysinibacillus piscis]|uniref:Diaminopimelate epimerase n=1 Tax=Lysinibacillus piscis TaxID=2518931 RepID=A0ABQ5NPQ4_9BACI|nr:DUF3267 domain-containing protein [Lysinibacillus sp. KH24]GLC90097.1 diaminopimelate epimerase [Lysinibacillus sp. KH24]
MLKEQQPIIIELNLKKMMRDNMIATILLSVLFVAIQYLYLKDFTFSIWSAISGILLFIVLNIILIILHEAFHLIGFMVFGKASLQSLSYGVDVKAGIAYATTEQPLPNYAMRKALLLPFWATGVLPVIVGFYFNSTATVLAGACLMAGAVGDFAMYKELRKHPKHAIIKDDPKLPKLYVYATLDNNQENV